MALNRLCIDTSAYVQFLHGSPDVVAAIDSAAWIGMPTVVLGELRTGFVLGDHADRDLELLGRFLDHSLVKLLDFDSEVARLYAQLVVELRRAETPVPTNDIWIAACAVVHGATVLTTDEHFRHMVRASSMLIEVA